MSRSVGLLVPSPAAAPQPTRLRTSSLVVTPAVVAHRGASGYRPEHTLDAYRTAIRMGADDIELDLVMSADGVLIARHENEISHTTDVAEHPAYAERRCTRSVDGVEHTGWFTEDFTVAELKTLSARERLPEDRPENTRYNDREGVPTLNEVLAMVAAESIRRGRAVGVMLELKHCAHFAARGLDMVPALLGDLGRHDLDHPRSRVTMMSFETTILRRLNQLTRVSLVQLLDRPDRRPADLAALGSPLRYADLITPAGLGAIDEYADGVGAHKDLVLPRDADGDIGEPSRLVRDAHRRWLTVHVWTLRAENRYLPTGLRRGPDPCAEGAMAGEVRAYLDAGVDGIITDHPDIALAVRDSVV